MIEESILSELTTLFGGRIYPDVSPQDIDRPFCTYSQVGGRPSATLCGDTDKQNCNMQFNVWATTRKEASTLMRSAAKILTGPPLRGVAQGGLVADYDHSVRLYGARQDFSFWYDDD